MKATVRKKVLITGKRGQLGKELLENSRVDKFDSEFEFFFIGRSDVNLLNEAETNALVKSIKPDFIIHTAAKVGGISFNIANKYKMLYENLNIDLNVINSSLKNNISNLIYFSSSCAYPPGGSQPFTTDLLFSGNFEATNEYYGLAKATITKLLEGFDTEEYLNYKTFILSNLYGRYDNFNLETSHILASAFRKIAEAKYSRLNEVEIWGDGTARREFTLAKDVAKFALNSLTNLSTYPSLLNLGSGKDFSVTEIYETIKAVLEYDINFRYNSEMPNGVASKLMDSNFAKNNLNWAPEEEILIGIESELKNIEFNFEKYQGKL
jgi:GDP-L-fucose synthase